MIDLDLQKGGPAKVRGTLGLRGKSSCEVHLELPQV